ncbi:MAG TPA: ABC transporter permease [Gemmatimonadaceae bacterium]|nr:ABC transporter permease [Gemmatimonadaceae bacterium]
MPFLEAIRLAFTQLRVQKLKSFFTLLGVTIGVMFLIAVVSVVNGMSRYVEEDFAGKFLGVNTFNVRKFPDIQTGDVTEATWREWQRRPPVTISDAEAVREVLPNGIRWAIQDLRWVTPQSAFRNGGPQVLASAVTAEYFAIKNLNVDRGRVFTEQEDLLGAPVVVVGQEVADFYFPGLDPIGRELKLEGLPFRVIGVLEKQGTVFGLSLDRQLIGPFHSPMQRVTHARVALYGVVVQAPNQTALTDAEERVREVMRKRRHLRPAEPDNFTFETSESALADWANLKKFLVIGGLVLPAIGLVVGAIVIMNIMLVAVADRTREIGIRKSLGARRRDILAQFLVEATTLSVIGAIFGIGLGVGLSALVAAASPLPASVAVWSIVVSVVLGAGVGILAGIYPASRAARLDPVIALRAD